jgi:hypothetical protein
MKRVGKVWDFLFGAALIGGAPLAALFVVMMVFFLFRPAFDDRLFVIIALILCGTAFVTACVWRSKHRRLRRLVLVAEILAAVFGISLFILACAAIVRIGGG